MPGMILGEIGSFAEGKGTAEAYRNAPKDFVEDGLFADEYEVEEEADLIDDEAEDLLTIAQELLYVGLCGYATV